MLTAFYDRLRDCIATAQPEDKCNKVASLWAAVSDQKIELVGDPVCEISEPGRPLLPSLVHPRKVPRRRLGSEAGRASLVHAIAHIEFNAINLALDAAYRFRDFPPDYYTDWLSVAWDEVRHFRMLQQRLVEMGHQYGDFPAHNGLWEMAVKTADDPMIRMALVPRVLEARGLDVTPAMINRLEAAGDPQTVAILRIILAEEVRHVAIGSRWFRWCCQQRGLDYEQVFRELLAEYYGVLKGPFNQSARLDAGFSADELEYLFRQAEAK